MTPAFSASRIASSSAGPLRLMSRPILSVRRHELGLLVLRRWSWAMNAAARWRRSMGDHRPHGAPMARAAPAMPTAGTGPSMVRFYATRLLSADGQARQARHDGDGNDANAPRWDGGAGGGAGGQSGCCGT